MYLEDYVIELDTPYNALRTLNKYMREEILENSVSLRKEKLEEFFDKILGLNYAINLITDDLENKRQDKRKIISEYYNEL